MWWVYLVHGELEAQQLAHGRRVEQLHAARTHRSRLAGGHLGAGVEQQVQHPAGTGGGTHAGDRLNASLGYANEVAARTLAGVRCVPSG